MAGPSGPAFLFNFYPRSPCGERLKAYRRASLAHRISIHALLAESDLRATCGPAGGRTFLSTLSLRRATRSSCKGISYFIFLSTLSLRRATFSVFASPFSIFYFYPRSPCGERPASAFLIGSRSQFLSTLSLRRATRLAPCSRHYSMDFYPRSPCGERPAIDVFLAVWAVISIHALLAESDVLQS